MRRRIDRLILIFWVSCVATAVANAAGASVLSGDFEGVGIPGCYRFMMLRMESLWNTILLHESVRYPIL